MIERFIYKSAIWVDLYKPTTEEIRQVITEFSISPSLTQDFHGPVPRSEAVVAEKVIKMTMDFPTVKRTDITQPHEIKFLVSKEFLITVRYEDISAVDNFKKDFEVLITLRKTSSSLTGANIFISLINELYEATATKLDYIQAKLIEVEDNIYEGNEKEMVFQISYLSRKLITFSQTLKAHDDVFRDAKHHFEAVFKNKYSDALDDLHMHYFHLIRRTTALFVTLEDFRNTNSALLTTKQNEIMKIFTILAFVTFPLTLFTSMFGMNTKTTPIVGQDGDFWIILGIMTTIAIIFFMFFKYKNWL